MDGVDNGGAPKPELVVREDVPEASIVLSMDEERVEVGRRGRIFGMLKMEAGEGGLEGGLLGAADVGGTLGTMVPLEEDADIEGGMDWNVAFVGVGVVMGLVVSEALSGLGCLMSDTCGVDGVDGDCT